MALLCSKQTSKTALKTLYQDRRQIELDLRNIKTTMGMEILSCRTPTMAKKEIWIYLLADLLPSQLSFKHTLQSWLSWRWGDPGNYGDEKLGRLFIMIAQQQVGKRPGCIEPRGTQETSEILSSAH
ncbi:MAG: hypothetical protein OI74_01530 [Gammaproteobacteria bacterium (ex Lamellibrachia satsuma)]|nr:MAG: hypothetical protein HPY30_04985 [Gammaproteobacteria bacterium (ex Lamellibrachia satsuma)]RRS35627.1 MAG: hypothetical protein OI74_01530 [Gammaproteobacteria bacterium (ex Lamellibrachia satsuma)]RRS36234.1 MAG: hypothetical protein NV67_08085 [Gammaproteobacteria bacterium (ex Lamellibrachia satsuma)]